MSTHEKKPIEKFNVWFAFGFCILAGLALLYLSGTYYVRDKQLAKSGIQVDAQIESGTQVRGSHGKAHPDNSFILNFNTLEGQAVQTQMSIPQVVYHDMVMAGKQGPQTARIRYLPTNPQIVDIVGAHHERMTFIVFCGLTGFLLLLCGVNGFRLNRRHAHCSAPHSTHIADW